MKLCVSESQSEPLRPEETIPQNQVRGRISPICCLSSPDVEDASQVLECKDSNYLATTPASFLAALRSLRSRALAFLASCCSRRAFFLVYSALSLWMNSIKTRLFLYTLPLHFK